MSSKQVVKLGVSLIKMTRNGQITLPAEVRRALQVKEGDYIVAEASDSGVYIKPISVVDREEADRQLSDILGRVKYTGPEPVPSIDKLAGDIADIIHDMRPDNAESGTR